MKIHIKKGDKTYGPYSEAKVKRLLGQGVISASDSANIEGTSKWITVEEAFTASAPVQKAPSASSTKQRPSLPNNVIVNGFDMPLGQLVNFLLKFWFANLLAGLVIALPIIFLFGLIRVLAES